MRFGFYYVIIAALVILTSCASTKKLTYFNDIAATTGTDSLNLPQQLRVQPGDILQITITTIDKDVSMIFNPMLLSNTGPGNNNIEQGYLVDSLGFITLPVAGKIYVKGKTTTTINDDVVAELSKTIRNVYVSTRLINFRISVLGDVAKPGSYKISSERITILDALSMAGDLNVTAKRNDVMIIREVDGVKSYTSLNLNDSKILSSPYYYLSNNDVVYIKPGPNRSFASSKTLQLLPAILSFISLISTIIILRN
jgi:polysaccharide biosynthesis/export protein